MKITFEEILGKMSVKEFKEIYWNKKPLHLSGAIPDVEKIFGLKEFENLYSRKELDGKWFCQLPNTNKDEKNYLSLLNGTQAAYLRRNGSYIGLESIESYIPSFSDLLVSIDHQLGSITKDYKTMFFYGDQNCDSHAHSDAGEVFCLQLAGSKSWMVDTGNHFKKTLVSVSENTYSITSPGDRNGDILTADEVMTKLEKFTLQAGDFLYVPAYAIHSVKNLEESNLSFSMSRVPKSAIEILNEVLRISEPNFYDRVSHALSINSDAKDIKKDFCSHLESLLSYLKNCDETSFALIPAMFSLMEFNINNAKHQLTTLNEGYRVTKKDRFRRNSSLGFRSMRHEENLHVFIGGKEFLFEGKKWENILPFLTSPLEFSAQDIYVALGMTSEEDWSELKTCLETLMSFQSILVISNSDF